MTEDQLYELCIPTESLEREARGYHCGRFWFCLLVGDKILSTQSGSIRDRVVLDWAKSEGAGLCYWACLVLARTDDDGP